MVFIKEGLKHKNPLRRHRESVIFDPVVIATDSDRKVDSVTSETVGTFVSGVSKNVISIYTDQIFPVGEGRKMIVKNEIRDGISVGVNGNFHGAVLIDGSPLHDVTLAISIPLSSQETSAFLENEISLKGLSNLDTIHNTVNEMTINYVNESGEYTEYSLKHINGEWECDYFANGTSYMTGTDKNITDPKVRQLDVNTFSKIKVAASSITDGFNMLNVLSLLAEASS